MQGGLMHAIAAKTVAFKERWSRSSRTTSKRLWTMPGRWRSADPGGHKIVSGGTGSHLFLLDLIIRDYTGDADAALGNAHGTVNKNRTERPRSPFVTSSLRLGHRRSPRAVLLNETQALGRHLRVLRTSTTRLP